MGLFAVSAGRSYEPCLILVKRNKQLLPIGRCFHVGCNTPPMTIVNGEKSRLSCRNLSMAPECGMTVVDREDGFLQI